MSTIVDRTLKARAALHFAKRLSTDKDNRLVSALIPGSEMKQYKTIIRRNGALSVECLLSTGMGDQPCQGNQKVVCYHALAALIMAAESAHKKVSFCNCAEDAARLTRTGGQSVEVKSHNGGRSVYMVVRDVAGKFAQTIAQEATASGRVIA